MDSSQCVLLAALEKAVVSAEEGCQISVSEFHLPVVPILLGAGRKP